MKEIRELYARIDPYKSTTEKNEEVAQLCFDFFDLYLKIEKRTDNDRRECLGTALILDKVITENQKEKLKILLENNSKRIFWRAVNILRMTLRKLENVSEQN